MTWSHKSSIKRKVTTVISGDALVPCISAASIIAKTYRDSLMRRLDNAQIQNARNQA